MKTKTIIHKTTRNGHTTETEDTIETPYYDTENSPFALNDTLDYLSQSEVTLSFDELKKKMLPEDWSKTKDLIRKITNYYIFDNPEQFIERFGLLVCNAKSKALGQMPKWEVIFSLFSPNMGIGKSWFRDMVAKTHDEVFNTKSASASYDLLLGQYGDILATRGLLCIDERHGLDSNQSEKLKQIITLHKFTIQRKYKAPLHIENYTTLFSATNESIKPVMGLQKDRRIIEFEVIGKTAEMPEEELHDLLVELWKVAPCDCPAGDKIKDELLAESTEVLDEKMGCIVCEIFETYGELILNDTIVKTLQLKTYLSKHKIPNDKFLNWCLSHGVIIKQKKGQYTLSKKELRKLQSARTVDDKDDIPRILELDFSGIENI